MRRSLLAITLAAGMLCLTGTPAWAGLTPTPDVSWTYNFTPNQSTITADAGNGTVSFSNNAPLTATNSSYVVVTNLRDTSSASPDHPATISGSNGNWSATLQLTDNASGLSKTMTFSGTISGTFSATSSNLTNTFGPNSTQTWTDPKNGNTYTVTVNSFTPPGPPNSANAGSIAAFVSVTPGVTTSNNGTPEPSTLVLSCLGLGITGLASWRKRRRSLAALLA